MKEVRQNSGVTLLRIMAWGEHDHSPGATEDAHSSLSERDIPTIAAFSGEFMDTGIAVWSDAARDESRLPGGVAAGDAPRPRRAPETPAGRRAGSIAHTAQRTVGESLPAPAVGRPVGHCIRKAETSGTDTRLASDLLAMSDPEERVRLLKAMLSVIGFQTLAYVAMREPGEDPVRNWALGAAAPHHFGSAYFDAGYDVNDPRLAVVSNSRAPLVWDLDWLLQAWRRAGSPQALRGVFDALAADDVRSGVMFGLRPVQGGSLAIVSLAAGRPSRDWINDSVLAQALTLGLALHRFASNPGRAPLALEPADEALSEMQMRVLACLAGGLSDKQIASRLQTTPHNVDYHLRLLRKRYCAANRTHLAFLAGRMALG